uniref:Link domain-containing protein n=1 Tax=Electrophorus electricus TaxID=8005 RepID=A0A4W4GWL8_ELEEL
MSFNILSLYFISLHIIRHTGKCSYAGVVHLEGGARYSLTFQQAQQLCQRSHYLLATEEQLKKAYEQGLKTCRLDLNIFLLVNPILIQPDLLYMLSHNFE